MPQRKRCLFLTYKKMTCELEDPLERCFPSIHPLLSMAGKLPQTCVVPTSTFPVSSPLPVAYGSGRSLLHLDYSSGHPGLSLPLQGSDDKPLCSEQAPLHKVGSSERRHGNCQPPALGLAVPFLLSLSVSSQEVGRYVIRWDLDTTRFKSNLCSMSGTYRMVTKIDSRAKWALE